MAVYTEVADDALAGFLEAYDIGRVVAFRGIAEGVENSNYSLRTTAGDFILTLYEKRVDPAELPWFLGLMEHLAAKSLPCPLPVRARDGRNLNPLAGRTAAITTFLPGIWPRRPTDAHCAPLGAALARLHVAGADYQAERVNARGPPGGRPLLDRCGDRADRVEPGLGGALAASLDDILDQWPQGLPRGQIHADLFPDNVFFLDGAISGLIDFYFAATDFFAYDIAVCLNAWCFEADLSFNITKSQAMLRGYQSVRPLGAKEGAALPVLSAGAAMRFLLTRLYDWINTPDGALVTRKDPMPYYRRLRFHTQTTSVTDYGL